MQIPTTSQYKEALQELQKKNKITNGQIKMLKAHFYAKNRTITFSELAKAGYNSSNHRSANIGYGNLAHKLLDTFILKEYNEQFKNEKRKNKWWIDFIGTWFANQEKNDDFQLMMHHELAHAIKHVDI